MLESYFFNSFILPIFDYGDIIWGDRGNVTLIRQDLQILQNTAARIILYRPFYSSASEALNKLSWEPLHRRRADHRRIFTYMCLNNLFAHSFQHDLNRL